MSKTYRHLPTTQFRAPRGRKAAIQRGDRSIPPDPWDDIPHNGEVERPWKVLHSLIEQGVDPETATERVAKRFHIAQWQQRQMLKTAQNWKRSSQ